LQRLFFRLRCKGRHIFNTDKRKTSFFHKKLFFLIFASFILEIKDFTLSLQPQNDGAIAQLVEQRTENPCVPGSIPGGTTLRENKTM
jgi:hypothetical protein